MSLINCRHKDSTMTADFAVNVFLAFYWHMQVNLGDQIFYPLTLQRRSSIGKLQKSISVSLLFLYLLKLLIKQGFRKFNF